MDQEMVERIRTQLRLQTGLKAKERTGDWSRVSGDHTEVWGDVSDISGDVSEILEVLNAPTKTPAPTPDLS